MITNFLFIIAICCIVWLNYGECRDEEKILKACFWPNEIYDPCFGGCAEVSCDNPRSHQRPCYPYCEPGCVCEDPYVRDDRTHQCVLPQDCSPTQMGIPVPTKVDRRAEKMPPPTQQLAKQVYRTSHRSRKADGADEFMEDLFPTASLPSPPNKEEYKITNKEDFKRLPDVSRMGNYFNIVIAPPPIKALQPRKMVNNGYIPALKRMS